MTLKTIFILGYFAKWDITSPISLFHTKNEGDKKMIFKKKIIIKLNFILS